MFTNEEVRRVLDAVADQMEKQATAIRNSETDHISVFLLLTDVQRLEKVMVELNQSFLINND